MKSFIFVVLSALLLVMMPKGVLADCQSYFDVKQDVAAANSLAADQKDAQDLKKAGDLLAAQGKYELAAAKYEAAAEKHPVAEVAAMYYWKAACATTGYLDKVKGWMHREDMSSDEATTGLSLLTRADNLLATPSPYCHKGVDVDTLKVLIRKVRSCINGVCK